MNKLKQQNKKNNRIQKNWKRIENEGKNEKIFKLQIRKLEINRTKQKWGE